MKHRREIDGLRGLAVIPVVLFHADLAGFSGGFLGVDIFFVISGYLITLLIFEEIFQGKFCIRTFYERRARRILPALFFVTGLCFPVAYFQMYPAQFKSFGLSVLSAIFFSSNYFFYSKINYFDNDTKLYPMIHTWSLAVEEQFYIVFPLLITALYVGGHRRIFPAVCSLLIASFLIAQLGGNFKASPPFLDATWSWVDPPSWSFYLLPARAWELLVGSLAACAAHFAPSLSQEQASIRRAQVCSAFGLALLIACLSMKIEGPMPHATLPTIGAFLVIVYARPGTLAHTILSQYALVAVGLMSYSLYLWHQPLLALARITWGSKLTNLQGLVIVSLSGALAFLTWRYIERPFRDRTRVSTTAVWAFAGLGSVAFVLAGSLAWALPASFIYGWRTQGLHEQLYRTAAMRDTSRACHTGGVDFRKPQDACVYFHKPPAIAVFGDSHGVELSGAIADRLAPSGKGVMQFTYSGSADLFGADDSHNPAVAWTHEAERYITSNANLKTVIIVYRINYYIEHPINHANEIISAYKKIINYFVSVGKQVILILPPPELDADINDLIKKDASGDPIISETRARWTSRLAELKSQLASLPDKVAIVDAADLFCGRSFCHATAGGIAYYFDDNHPSTEGAARIADAVMDAIRKCSGHCHRGL